MASIFYDPCVKILKAHEGQQLRVNEIMRDLTGGAFPELKWSGGQGPVRAMLLAASANDSTPIKQVQGVLPPKFYYSEVKNSVKIVAPEATPEEIMDEAFSRAVEALKESLLDIIMKMDDTQFEVLVNKLISKMGFGRAETTQQSGDHGIDGFIYGDRLGLNVICVQAKHYDGHNVQRPEIDSFIGALEGRDGVFVTSSGFSPEAKKKAEKTGSISKIALIDGKQLVEYMIEFDVGVQATGKVYALKRIDKDFFEEMDD